MFFQTMIEMEKNAYPVVLRSNSLGNVISRVALMGNGDIIIYPWTKELLIEYFTKGHLQYLDELNKNTKRVVLHCPDFYNGIDVFQPNDIMYLQRGQYTSIILLRYYVDYRNQPRVV